MAEIQRIDHAEFEFFGITNKGEWFYDKQVMDRNHIWTNIDAIVWQQKYIACLEPQMKVFTTTCLVFFSEMPGSFRLLGSIA